jgi:hypothetical protein
MLGIVESLPKVNEPQTDRILGATLIGLAEP